MKKRFSIRPVDSAQDVMARLGYKYHCATNGRLCFHRPWNDVKFPRFHALMDESEKWIEIDLHVDAHDPITHRGNHEHAWAYQGGKVIVEMNRITDVLQKVPVPKIVGMDRLKKKAYPKRVVKNVIDLIFFDTMHV